MSLIKQILNYRKGPKRLLFTTPTLSQGNFIEPENEKLLGSRVFKCDYSEIEGFDNLRNPNGILKELLEKLSRIYRTKATFILTNGSSSGITAAMLATLKKDEKVLIARNCHVSVYNGLVLTGAKPVWIKPKYNSEWGIYEGLSKEEVQTAINENQDAKALILTSPTYEGIFTDIKEISEITQRSGIKLIVDEAHGALLNFGNFKTEPAVQCGADISIQSLHKTAGALTPAALLHIRAGASVTPDEIQDALNILNTTSPSYPLMASIEATVNYLNSDKGKAMIRRLQRAIRKFKKQIETKPNFKIFDGFNDPTKILFKYEGVSGEKIADYLNQKLNIEEEFANAKSVLFITGAGTSKWKLFRLFYALSKLKPEKDEDIHDLYAELPLPKQVMTPFEAFNANKTISIISDALNQTAAEPILNYPPGIPVIMPGEVIDEDILRFINQNSIKVIKN